MRKNPGCDGRRKKRLRAGNKDENLGLDKECEGLSKKKLGWGTGNTSQRK